MIDQRNNKKRVVSEKYFENQFAWGEKVIILKMTKKRVPFALDPIP
jgi:hypothetical protein